MPWLLLSLRALQPVTELGCRLCSPGLKHHRIQRLPGINLPVKHFQDSLWQGLFNKSILAQRQHCPCRVAGVCVCARAYVYQCFLNVCMALRRRPVLACCARAAGPLRLSCTPLALEGVPVLHAGPCHAAGQVAVTDCPTEDGITAAFSAHTKQAAESRDILTAGPGRRMKPDPSRLLVREGCFAPWSGEERGT